MRNLPTVLRDAEDRLRIVGSVSVAQQWRSRRENLHDNELRAVLFGEFNRGKSTIINALLGRIVLPAKLIPTTGLVTRVVFGDHEQLRIMYKTGRVDTAALDQIDSLASLNREGEARRDIELIEVAVNSPLLQEGLVLIDTPGSNEHDSQTRRAQYAVSTADLILLVLDARQIVNSGERALAQGWLAQRTGRAGIALIVNFMNMVPESERITVRDRLNNWALTDPGNALGARWFEVNALGALRCTVQQEPFIDDDFAALQAALYGLQGNALRRLQRRSRYFQLLAEVREIQAENTDILGRLRDNADKLERERAAKREAIALIRERFDTIAEAQSERLILFAQSTMRDALRELVDGLFKGKNKQTLESQANTWYKDALHRSVHAIESDANRALAELAGEILRCPDILTVGEELVIDARLSSGRSDATNSILADPVLFPVTRIAVSLVEYFLRQQKDYPGLFGESARTAWSGDSQWIERTLQLQVADRVAKMRYQIAELWLQQDMRASVESPSIAVSSQAVATLAHRIWSDALGEPGSFQQCWLRAEHLLWIRWAEAQPSAVERQNREALEESLEICSEYLERALGLRTEAVGPPMAGAGT